MRTDGVITVVIPVRNRERLIARCLDSVKAQTWRRLKVVVVDNGSSDHTCDVVKEWIRINSTPDLGVTLIEETTPGAACARNRGLRDVETKYVLFFDSDDVMHPDLVSEAMHGFNTNDAVDIVHWRSRLIHHNGSVKKRKFNVSDYWRYHVYHALFSTQCFAVRVDYFRQIGSWNDNLAGWDDWELGIRMLLGNPAMIAVDKVLVDIYPQKESITGENFHSKAGEWERAIDTAEKAVVDSGHKDSAWIIDMINYRRAILAAHYQREKRPDLAAPLLEKALSHPDLTRWRRWLLKMLYRYTALGGRGAYLLWS